MITIEMIAKKAGVSKTAVSFALNNKPGISEETRNRILRIARSEGYFDKPVSDAAKSKNILLLMCSRTNITTLDRTTAPFYSELISEVEKSADEAGYHLLLKSLKIEDGKEIAPVFSSLLNDLAGVLVIATDILPEDVKIFAGLSPHIVLLDSLFATINVNCVVMDNYMGGYIAAEHLAQLNHKKIGYVESCHRVYNFDSRKQGFLAGLNQHGLKLDPAHQYCTTPIIDIAKRELSERINPADMPTAFFAENDYLAIGLMEGLSKLGLNLPADASVIGFDDIELASFVTPKLTTIRVFKSQMARAAIQKLINQINNDIAIAAKEIVSIDLIKRGSCIYNP